MSKHVTDVNVVAKLIKNIFPIGKVQIKSSEIVARLHGLFLFHEQTICGFTSVGNNITASTH